MLNDLIKYLIVVLCFSFHPSSFFHSNSRLLLISTWLIDERESNQQTINFIILFHHKLYKYINLFSNWITRQTFCLCLSTCMHVWKALHDGFSNTKKYWMKDSNRYKNSALYEWWEWWGEEVQMYKTCKTDADVSYFWRLSYSHSTRTTNDGKTPSQAHHWLKYKVGYEKSFMFKSRKTTTNFS
jgi:hypothetical protein